MSSGSQATALAALNAPRWPRQYAAEICALEGREARAEALERVPAHLRDWVRDLVVLTFERRAARRRAEAREVTGTYP